MRGGKNDYTINIIHACDLWHWNESGVGGDREKVREIAKADGRVRGCQKKN